MKLLLGLLRIVDQCVRDNISLTFIAFAVLYSYQGWSIRDGYEAARILKTSACAASNARIQTVIDFHNQLANDSAKKAIAEFAFRDHWKTYLNTTVKQSSSAAVRNSVRNIPRDWAALAKSDASMAELRIRYVHELASDYDRSCQDRPPTPRPF